MGTSPMELIERMRGKSLTAEEKDMFLRMKDELGCGDEDALWQVVAVLEFQKIFYLELPKKITDQTKKIMAEISTTAANEVAIAQGKLVESVVEQAKVLSIKYRLSTIIILALGALALFLMVGSLMMWAGYQIGSGRAQPPEFMFQMPTGVVIGILMVGMAVVFCRWAAFAYSEEEKRWWRWLCAALGCAVPAAWIFALTI